MRLNYSDGYADDPCNDCGYRECRCTKEERDNTRTFSIIDLRDMQEVATVELYSFDPKLRTKLARRMELVAADKGIPNDELIYEEVEEGEAA